MVGEESFDAAEEEAHAAFAIGEGHATGGQSLSSPALYCFAGDAEFFGDIVDGEDGFGDGGGLEVEGIADSFDQ